MHNRLAVILLLASSAFPQIVTRANQSGIRVSYLHNHWAVPGGGTGTLYLFDLYNPTLNGSNCNVGGAVVRQNDSGRSGASSFDVASTGDCGIVLTGVAMATGTGYLTTGANAPTLGAWTVASAFTPTSTTGQQQCGVNNRVTAGATQEQVQMGISGHATKDYYFCYQPAAAIQCFATTGTPATTGWQLMTGAYTSATAASAKIFQGNTIQAGTWTNGTGTVAIADPGAPFRFLSNAGTGLACNGTHGFHIVWTSQLTDYEMAGPLHNALVRAMQFRNVALP